MKYKTVYQLRWLAVIWLIFLIYLSNLIFIKLPFSSISFPKKDLDHGLFEFLYSFFPVIHLQLEIYNLQTIVVWLSGILFGPLIGTIAVLIYLSLGFLGLPVFAGGGGLDYFREPTFGYLISLPLNAYLSGWLFERNQKYLAAIIPVFATHIMGILYLLLFNRLWLQITWHLSFSMITYDLIFTLLLILILPPIVFFSRELFMQEVPVREPVSEENIIRRRIH